MEELIQIRQFIQQGKLNEALQIVDELEEMSLSDKINKIDSYGVILLIHLIKQNAEKRSTRSWEISIQNSVREINKINKRKKTEGYYLTNEELLQILEEGYPIAIKRAALEAFEGRYEAEELATMVNRPAILSQAIELFKI
ncbi:DUF29 domain-containing protein [Ancylothrix sp. C2]|uniref:DUF29 domain-containing protein n=1 Tax=Ancylothrix sp. D3o TaxID=2953691 RepID=UPI0021BA579C|nr:DUF29 domain-containing protein [Ancylothrix sp. D3o]MCT7951560.1 DUF29 domain-containing protein [Ancylothrix sp. D3o]